MVISQHLIVFKDCLYIVFNENHTSLEEMFLVIFDKIKIFFAITTSTKLNPTTN